MSDLALRLRRLIEEEGPIGIARYMTLALAHPRLGYYPRRVPLGAAGDFVTAPEISQLFGELLGICLAQHWLDLGGPEPLHLVELGPGRGTMMADLLRALRTVPALAQAVRVHLVETSPALREVQGRRLAGLDVRWHDQPDSVPETGTLFFVANEFLDALPVRQFARMGEAWHERLVGIDAHGRFGLTLDPRPMPLRIEPPWVAGGWAEGTVIELGPAREAAARFIALRIVAQGGLALLIDYGDGGAFTVGDTLQAVRRHRKVDPLSMPGECDLTAHVAMGGLLASGAAAGAAAWGPVAQATFLGRLGITARLESSGKAGAAGPARAPDRPATTVSWRRRRWASCSRR